MITDYTCRPVYLRTDRQTHSLNEWMTWWCDDNARWRSTELTCHNFFGFVVGQEKLNESCNYWAVIAGWYDTTSAALHSRFNFRVSPSNTQLVPGCRHTVLVEVGMNERRMVNKSTNCTIPFPNVIPVTPVTPATNTRMPRNVVCQCGWCVWAKTDFLMHENRNSSSSAGSRQLSR